ncbi:MAG: DUF3576 domain-containing protein [Sphingomonadales bacterium]
MTFRNPLILGLALALLLSGCGIFGGGKDKSGRIKVTEDMTTAIGVNGYLWKASLDSLASLPISQTDSGGGIIITDWFIDPSVPTERLKVTITISDRRLRADALDVFVYRQVLREGVWLKASVQEGTEKKIEDTILTRARALWIQTLDD